MDRRHADADAHFKNFTLMVKTELLDGLQQFVGNAACTIHGAIQQQHAELVTAETRQGIAAADDGAQGVGYFKQ